MFLLHYENDYMMITLNLLHEHTYSTKAQNAPPKSPELEEAAEQAVTKPAAWRKKH
jgi:hypothetical protein